MQKEDIIVRRDKGKRIQSFIWVFLWIFGLTGIFINPLIGFAALVCMIAPVVVAIFRGRYWCGWYCPRGSFYDHILSRFSPKKPVPKLLRKTWFRTVVFITLMTLLTMQIILSHGDPYKIGYVFIRLIVITSLVGIILGVFFHQRSWCAFCPMGTLASWLGKGKKSLTINSSCVNCKACTKVCPMELPINEFREQKEIKHGDCLKCYRCAEKCPKDAIGESCDMVMDKKLDQNEKRKQNIGA